MISAEEVTEKSISEGINTSDVQRDYVFSWILAGLYRQSKLADELVLKGGNLYRKAYFASTRFSNDLDFTTERGLDPNRLLAELNGICEYIGAETGIEFDQDRNEIKGEHFITETKSAFKVRLYFKGFFGENDSMTLKVNLDVAQFDKIYLTPAARPLIHPYSDVENLATDIMAIRLEEALADKLKCLIQRRHSFDLFDLVHAIFIDKTLDVNKSEMVQVFLKKTIFESSPQVAKNLLLGVPFDLMSGFWSKLVCPRNSMFGFDEAVAIFRRGLPELFVGLANYGSELAFYPSDLRNLILQAGADRKLLSITYHGHTRLIEPYSLKYQVTKDGTGREYFYAWDRTGGGSGNVGIKRFLNQDIQDLRPTEEIFEPQFEIELAKAGELHGSINAGNREHRVSAILGRPTPTARPVRQVRAYRSSLVGAATHIFACPRCGKKYYRSDRSNSMIKPHKRTKFSRYQDCYGGFGRYVGQKR